MHHKRLWSDALGRFVAVKVRARVLRTMDKCGGLDGYLLGEKPARVKELGVEGWRLRWLVMRTGKTRRAVRGQREALGLLDRTRDAETLGEEVERASGEVVGRIGGARAAAAGGPLAAEDEDEDDEEEEDEDEEEEEASTPMTLEDRINRTTQAVEAATAAEIIRQARAFPRPYEPNLAGLEKRLWGDEPAAKSDAEKAAEEKAAEKAAARLADQVARTDAAVEAEMDDLREQERHKVEFAIAMLGGAREELGRVRAEAEAKRQAQGKGGLWGRVKRLLW